MKVNFRRAAGKRLVHRSYVCCKAGLPCLKLIRRGSGFRPLTSLPAVIDTTLSVGGYATYTWCIWVLCGQKIALNYFSIWINVKHVQNQYLLFDFFFLQRSRVLFILWQNILHWNVFFFQGLFSRLDSMYALLIYALSSLLACKTWTENRP